MSSSSTSSDKINPPGRTNEDPKQRLSELLVRFDTAMMTSECGRTHQLHSRPMVVARIDDGLNLWFFTDWSAPKLEEVKSNEHLCATFQDSDSWVSLSGRGRIENDLTLKQQLWNAGGDKLRKWFPENTSLEGLTLLELETQWGEYWDSRGASTQLQFGLEALKSYVTGSRVDASKAGDHAKLSLDSSSAPTGISAQ